MTSRCVKPIRALLVALAASVGFAASATAAPPAGLNWEVHGTGSGSVTVAFGGSSSGPAMPQYVGNATYSVTLFTPMVFTGNGAGGACSIATGSGAIEAADGSRIQFVTVGMLCNQGDSMSPVHYNGTYEIRGGTGRFVGVDGGGSLTATFDSPNFFKIDGTITGI
jgi:hypothetical protein